MTTWQPDARTPASDGPPTLRRRGLFAAAAAAVVGLVARWSEAPLHAGNDGDVVLGADNSASGNTSITSLSPSDTALTLVSTAFAGSNGLNAFANGIAVRGAVAGPTGGIGVEGTGGAGGIGVLGTSFTASGVQGSSVVGNALLGQIPSFSDANTIAIYGQNYSTYAGPSPGAGGFGIYGLSAKGHGLVGATAAAGGAAVVGATNGVAGAYAGAFYGPLIVSGSLTVLGAKSAAVPHSDGSHRRLYCMESPESWFEDFGNGQLDCGQADVAIDPDFAAVVDTDGYHVFVSGYDDFELRVTDRTGTGFRVLAKDLTSAGRFSWRIVARRRDIPAPRFETVRVPAEPVLPPTRPDPPPPVIDVRQAKTGTRP